MITLTNDVGLFIVLERASVGDCFFMISEAVRSGGLSAAGFSVGELNLESEIARLDGFQADDDYLDGNVQYAPWGVRDGLAVLLGDDGEPLDDESGISFGVSSLSVPRFAHVPLYGRIFPGQLFLSEYWVVTLGVPVLAINLTRRKGSDEHKAMLHTLEEVSVKLASSLVKSGIAVSAFWRNLRDLKTWISPMRNGVLPIERMVSYRGAIRTEIDFSHPHVETVKCDNVVTYEYKNWAMANPKQFSPEVARAFWKIGLFDPVALS